jgi:hypothetical protein
LKPPLSCHGRQLVKPPVELKPGGSRGVVCNSKTADELVFEVICLLCASLAGCFGAAQAVSAATHQQQAAAMQSLGWLLPLGCCSNNQARKCFNTSSFHHSKLACGDEVGVYRMQEAAVHTRQDFC